MGGYCLLNIKLSDFTLLAHCGCFCNLPTLIKSDLLVEGSLIFEVASMIEKAKSVTYSAWLGVNSGAPQITMYASPMVST